MPETAKHITRFRKNLKQFTQLNEAGKLNGQAMAIKKKLKAIAETIGLDFEKELSQLEKEKPAGTSGRESQKEQLPDRPSTGSKKDAKKSKQRENPVEVPFTITLREIDQLHSIRSVKKLNSYVGHKHPCYIARHSGEKPNAHISFKYDPDYRNKKYTLDLLLDGKLEFTACAEGVNKNFTSAWEQVLNKYGNLAVEIRSQDHAKKVLGAVEYRRQEQEQAKKSPADKKSDKTYKDFPVGSSVKTAGLPLKIDGETNPLLGAVGVVTHAQKNDVVVEIKGYGETGFLPENLQLISDTPADSSNENKSKTKTKSDALLNKIKSEMDKAGLSYTGANEGLAEGVKRAVEYTNQFGFDKWKETTAYGQALQQIVKDLSNYKEPGGEKKEAEKVEQNNQVYKPAFSQLATYLAFSRAQEYDYEERFVSRIENYLRENFVDSKKNIVIKETWHNREYDQDHERWHQISRGGKYETLYSQNVPGEKELKAVDVDTVIPAGKRTQKPAYDISKSPSSKRIKINRSVLLREIILGKMEAAMYKSFDGMIDSSVMINDAEKDWFDPAESGFFWSRNFRDFQAASYSSPYHSEPNEISLGDYEYRYKAFKGVEEKSTPKNTLNVNMAEGEDTTIDFKADGSVSVPGFYAIVEADDAVASHNKDCTPNSKHTISKAQPRNRSLEALCAQPKFIAKNLNPTSITAGNLAFNGAPVLTTALQAIQGNGRIISLKILYDELPKKAMEYRTFLINNASNWGFTKQRIGGFKKPVLVRVADATDARAIELGNIVDTSQAKLNKVDAAKAYVRNLADGKRKIIGDIINDSKGETLGEVIEDKGLKIFDQFKDLDRSDLVDKNKLTGEGKDFLRSVFAGLVFDSDTQKNALQGFLNLPHTIKAGIERAYGYIIPLVGTKGDISPKIRGAVLIIDELAKRTDFKTINELFSSTDAFSGNFADNFNAEEKALAEFFNQATTQKEIRDAFRVYQYFITGKEDLFNSIKKTSPERAFKLAFIEKKRINPIWSDDTANKISKLDKEFYELVEEKGLNPNSKEAADLWKSSGFQKRFKQITNEGRAHELKIRIQRLQSLGNDNSKEIKQLNKLIGKDGWSWNSGKTQIIIGKHRPNPKTAKFIFLGVVDKILIDQGGPSLVELQGPHAMLTNKGQSKLYVVPFAFISEFKGCVKDKKAEQIFKEWSNYAADSKDLQVQWPDEEKSLPVGTAHSIYYLSDKVLQAGDKKGKMNVYHHDFDAGKRPATKKGNILIIGNLEINERGILN